MNLVSDFSRAATKDDGIYCCLVREQHLYTTFYNALWDILNEVNYTKYSDLHLTLGHSRFPGV